MAAKVRRKPLRKHMARSTDCRRGFFQRSRDFASVLCFEGWFVSGKPACWPQSGVGFAARVPSWAQFPPSDGGETVLGGNRKPPTHE